MEANRKKQSVTTLMEKGEHDQVFEIGSLRITAYLVDGKTVLNINSLPMADFISIQPVTSNAIIIKSGKKLEV